MATNVYVVRHAEAEGNLYRRCHGQYNALLTTKAARQIEAVSERFRNIDVDVIYSSDLFRAYNTAMGIANVKGLPVIKSKNLREADMGIWEDLMWGELPIKYPNEYDEWLNKPWKCRVDGGENILDSGKRILDEIGKIVELNRGKNIVVATHGIAIRSMLCIIEKDSCEDILQVPWCDNTAVSKLVFDDLDNVLVEYSNDNSHLGDDISTFAKQSWWREAEVRVSHNIWLRSVDIGQDRETILNLISHITEDNLSSLGISTDSILSRVAELLAINNRAVTIGVLDDMVVCLVILNVDDTSIPDSGGILLVTMDPQYIGKRLAVQMIGHAISVYRNLGKNYIHVGVLKSNTVAIAYFKNHGFFEIGMDNNSVILQKDIRVVD